MCIRAYLAHFAIEISDHSSNVLDTRCMATNNPVTICATRQIPRSEPKFHHPVLVDGVGKSIKALFAILNRGRLFLVGLFIILCVVKVPWIH